MFFEGQSLKLYAAHMVAGIKFESPLSQHPVLKNIKGPFRAEYVQGGQAWMKQGKPSWKLDIEQYLVSA